MVSSPAPPVPEIGVVTVTPESVPDEPEFIEIKRKPKQAAETVKATVIK